MSVICCEKNCKKNIKSNENFILCAFGCSNAIHIKCSKLTESELHFINSNMNIKYSCDECVNKGLESVNKKINDLSNNFKELSEKNRILFDNLEENKKNMSELKIEVLKEIKKINNNNDENIKNMSEFKN